MRTNLWDDPRVARLCDATGQCEAMVIGALFWLWSAADTHSVDGHMAGLSLRQIDRKSGVAGFGAALAEIGWVAETPTGVTLCRFNEHNGASAKKRSQAAIRQAVFKKNNAADAVALAPAQATRTPKIAPADANSVTRALAPRYLEVEKEQDKNQTIGPSRVGGRQPLPRAQPSLNPTLAAAPAAPHGCAAGAAHAAAPPTPPEPQPPQPQPAYATPPPPTPPQPTPPQPQPAYATPPPPTPPQPQPPQPTPPQPQPAYATPPPTRQGALSQRLRLLGFAAAPHYAAWETLLAGFSDEEILAAASAARAAKPGQRIHLNYLVPLLADRKPPAGAPRAAGPPAAASARQARIDDYIAQAATARRAQQPRGDNESGNTSFGDSSRTFEGDATRVA